MGKPAARMGDMTAHGGAIVKGEPTVLIGGLPAARVGDMHTCPMVNPGVPPPPHVGGPIMPPGCPTVLIGGLPAACVGDMATCAGPPDTILPPGCPTVLIGSGGGGGGGGAGAGQGGGKSATAKGDTGDADNASDSDSQTDSEASPQEDTGFLNLKFVDAGGKPIHGVKYALKGPDGETEEGQLGGQIKKTGLKPGDWEVRLKSITSAAWSTNRVSLGDKVDAVVHTAGIENGETGTIEIWRCEIGQPDRKVASLTRIPVRNNKFTAQWEPRLPDEEIALVDLDGQPQQRSDNRFYFMASCQGSIGRSGWLTVTTTFELTINDPDGNPIADQEYEIHLPNGEIRNGKLDRDGKLVENKVPLGNCYVRLPALQPPPPSGDDTQQ